MPARNLALAALIAALLLPIYTTTGRSAPAGAPTATVHITGVAFKPAILVVPPGTRVAWRNDDTRVHAPVGDAWSSPDLPPGASFGRVFATPGTWRYHDRRQPSLTGTVVVPLWGAAAGGGAAPPAGATPPTGIVHHFRAALSFAMQERWTYYDSKWHSTTGTCNGMVGGGSRSVRWAVSFPDVTYGRYPEFEALTVRPPGATTLDVYREAQVAKVIPLDGREQVTCPDGATNFAATEDAGCRNDGTGTRVQMTIGWSPTIGGTGSGGGGRSIGRFVFSHTGSYAYDKPVCGPLYEGNLVLIGLADEEQLPLSFGGDPLSYVDGSTPARPDEVALLRQGKQVRVQRRLDLDFTTPCCSAFVPVGAALGRIGAIFQVRATLDLLLQPQPSQ